MSDDENNILLLEDDVVQTMLFQSAAQGVLGNVHTFDSVAEALVIMRRKPFKLCVVDLAVFSDFQKFDDHGGIRFIETVRSEISKTVPILVATNSNDPANLIPCFTAGADDYVIKTEGMEALVKRSKKWVEDTELTEETMNGRREEIIALLEGMAS